MGGQSTATPMRVLEQLKSEKQQRTSTDSGNVGLQKIDAELL
jgi:hypothetical protein